MCLVESPLDWYAVKNMFGWENLYFFTGKISPCAGLVRFDLNRIFIYMNKENILIFIIEESRQKITFVMKFAPLQILLEICLKANS